MALATVAMAMSLICALNGNAWPLVPCGIAGGRSEPARPSHLALALVADLLLVRVGVRPGAVLRQV